MIENVTAKMVISGKIIELYEYEKGYLKGYKDKTLTTGRQEDYQSENKDDNRQKAMQRARTDIRRLINANAYDFSKFLTLTFEKNETDLDYCNYEFKKFILRLKYKYDDFKYLVVVEFQKRGAVHYHMLCNLPYIKSKEISDIWGNGFIKINRIDRVSNLGAYVTKYLQKDTTDPRLEKRKCYFTSRNLDKPIEITQKKEIEQLQTTLIRNLNPIFKTSYNNDYTGKVMYKQYNLETGSNVYSRTVIDDKNVFMADSD